MESILTNLITSNIQYQIHFIDYLICIEHRFEFPLRELQVLRLKESTIIELMELFNQRLKRYKRRHR